jgi:hypothetical protein
MRYSNHKKLPTVDLDAKSPREFFEDVMTSTKADEREGALLLVGGRRHSDLLVRQAQAPLRLDRLLSAWSHAAIILHWPDKATPSSVLGAEVTLNPESGHEQLPEHNGVTFFALDRYLESDKFPNLAIAILKNCEEEKDRKRIDAIRACIRKAALAPAVDQVRFPLFDWLGSWQAYAFGSAPNPLLNHIPHPGAAFCESVYRAAGLDPTSSATDLNTCPEVIWSSLLYWYGCLHSDKDGLRVFRHRTDSQGQQRYPEAEINLQAAFSTLKSKLTKRTTRSKKPGAKKKKKKKA